LRFGQLKGRNTLLEEKLSTKRLRHSTFPESEMETKKKVKQIDRSGHRIGHNTVPAVRIRVIGRLLAESHINPLKMKRRMLDLKTQFVPRSKHSSSRL
jgi:hypothetical protein